MSWRLFLDDVRDVDWIYPDEDSADYVVCRSFSEAVGLCQSKGCPSFISFDHDLGENTPTGMDFARWLVEQDMDTGCIPNSFEWRVHSANPIGAANIEGLLHAYFEAKKNWKALDASST